MKKIALLFLTLSTLLFAQVAKVVALKGDASVQRNNSNISLEVGSTLEKNDVIQTQDGTKLQVIFNDETIITIGKNSTFAVNDYIFDAQNKEYKAEFGLLKGTFRTITGKIGKIAPDKFKLKSKSSSIGIRGTQILSNVQISGDTIFCTEGTITITSNITGETITINAGQYVVIKKGEPMSAQEFDTENIGETDSDTKFLSDEEKESALNEFGVELNSETNNEELAQDPTNSEITTETADTTVYDSLDDATSSVSPSVTGYLIEYNTSNYTTGTLSNGTSTLTDPDAENNIPLILNNFASNFETDGSYTGTLSASGSITHGDVSGFGLSTSTYSSKPDDYDGDTYYNTDDDIQWGEWSANLIGPDGFTINGYWLAGNETALSEVEALMSAGTSVTYNGYALGNGGSGTFDASNTTVQLSIDFGSTAVSGDFTIHGTVMNVSGNASKNGFTFSASDSGHSGGGKGNYYGSNAASVGGQFSLNDGNYDYQGVFKASR